MTKMPYIFKARSISKSQLGRKKPCDLLTAAKHNCRELTAESGHYGRVDPTLTRLNEYVIGPNSANEIAAQAAEDALVPDRTGKSLRHDHTQAIELIFSLPLIFGGESKPIFIACVDWAVKAFAGQRIYSAIIHYDEGPPHCHVLISPIRYGVRVGSEVIDRASMAKLKDKFWCEVASVYGLAMPAPRLKGVRKREAVKKVVQYLSNESRPCVESQLWPFMEAAINHDPAMALHYIISNADGAST